MTRIMQCTCESEYQDKKYGKNMGLFNETGKGKTGPEIYRCTVCGKEKQK